MVNKKFEPDWSSPPGDTIRELMEEREWNESKLALELETDKLHVSRLLEGKAYIDEDIAGALYDAFGVSKRFWLQRERYYRGVSL